MCSRSVLCNLGFLMDWLRVGHISTLSYVHENLLLIGTLQYSGLQQSGPQQSGPQQSLCSLYRQYRLYDFQSS